MVNRDDIKAMLATSELIASGLRLSIAREMVNISIRTVRHWWREAHGRSPSGGKLPGTVLSFIRNAESAAKVSAYATLHQRLRGADLSPESLLAVWREFGQLCGPIDVNAALFAIRDIRTHTVVLTRCTKCGATYIYDSGTRHTDRCPFCKTRAIEE